MEREKAAARGEKISAIRDQVGEFTDQMIRSFGAKLSLGGGGSVPGTGTGGGGGSGGFGLIGHMFNSGGKLNLPPILGL